MADLTPFWHAARKASETSEEDLAHIRRRVETSIDTHGDVRPLLVDDVHADPEMVARIAARVERSATTRRRARIGVLAAAAAALLVVVRPSPALDESLVATDLERALTGDVMLTIDGEGHAAGTTDEPRITWKRGRLDLQVTPNAGIDLQVETPEATVTVVGTVFTVDRTPLGTTVHVERGAVEVDCHSEGGSRLHATEQLTCWPTTSAGLLGRARTLKSQGAPMESVLSTLDVALATSGPPAVRGEVLALRVSLLHDGGRQQEARVTAQTYLDEGHLPRRAAIQRFLDDVGRRP